MTRALATALSLLALGLAAPSAMADQSSARFPASASGRIDSGSWHTCAIAGDGKVHCWGYGQTYGALGYGNTENIGDDETIASAGAVDLGAGRTAKEVTGGEFHTCAILDNGTVKCWGANQWGQLGYGNNTYVGDDETPASVGIVDLGAGRTAKSISAGEAHNCAILDNGTVRCWGGNSFGQLGYGNTNPIGDNETPGSAGPVDLGAGRTAVAISAGTVYTCAILDNGSVRCWGFNSDGQLGYGNTTTIGDNETPASAGPVDLGGGHTAVAISAGWNSTCAILDNGSVKCWGSGEHGKLGYGNTNNVLNPASVGTVDLGAGRTAVAISASENHTCAILDNGTVRCWGEGAYGQLGYGNQNDVGDNETPGSVGPVDLGAGRRAVGITSGKYFTCAELDNGTVRCWGENFYGQLGYGFKERIGDNESPGSVAPASLGGSGVLETAAGGTHTCARFDTGVVRCWGNGAGGRLGYGNTANVGDSANVGTAGTVELGGSAVQIVAGEGHTCALLAEGAVRCWGMNGVGQLGYGNTENVGDNETPGSVSPVSLGASAIRIAAGTSYTCALLTEGAVRCWGLNSEGQLGYGFTGSVGDNESPSSVGPVSLGASAVGISAGGSHTCARLADGTARCWGNGANGRLGYGNTNTIGDNEGLSLVGPVSLGGSALSVVAGGSHSCALLSDGTLRCWGLGSSGQLGYGNTNTIGDNELPSSVGGVNVGSGRDTAMVSAGEAHTCAVLNNGTVRCWGSGSKGRLGYANTTTIGDDEVPGSVGPVDLGGVSALGVSAGGSHTCATLADGTVRCWGQNDFGQLGYGNTTTIGDNEPPGSVGPVDFVDDPPVAVNDSKTLNEDSGATAIDALANDTDADGGPKSIASKTNGSHGTVAITGGGTGLTYTPNADYCGSDSFTYELTPGGSTATVAVTVTCVDDSPVAVNDSKTLAEDAGPTAIEVLANDTDIDGGPKQIVSKSDGAHGTVAITGTGAGTGLTYVPAANYCGADSFTYTLNGGSTATVSVTVTCVDDPPVAVNDLATLAEDSGANAVDVLANDTDIDGGPKSIESKSNGSHGTVAVTGGGAGLTYTPNANYCGADSFTYTLNGGSTATVSITVTCVDDPPVAVDDSATLAEDAGATPVGVLANDTDIDGGPKEIVAKTNGPHGTVAITGGGTGLTYAPAADYCGADSFTYTLNGGSTATVSVTVTCVDDPPVAVDDSATVAEDASATLVDALANDTDVDGGSKSIVSKTDGSHGAVSIIGGGAGLTYQPASNYCGSDSFTYTLNGGSTATVSITVTCVDDPPVAVGDSATLTEDASATAIDVLANDTDIDGGPKEATSKTDGAHGTVAITGGGTGLTYQPASNYCGSDSFTYTLNGGSTAIVSVTVTCVDDPPVAVDDSATVAEDSGTTAIDVRANDTDIDAGPKSIESVTQPSHGTAAITGGGSGLTYAPAADYCGSDSFTYTLNGGSAAIVSVAVTCVDDPPVAVADSDTVLENSAAQAIDVLANDTDVDGGPKTIAGKTNGAHGVVSIIGGGAGLTYQPEANYCGPDSFTYALDGGSQAGVAISVTCVAPPEEKGGGGGGGSTQTIIQNPGPTGPVVNVTPGVGVVSGRRHPRIAVKDTYAFFTLTCRLTERDCTGVVTISASIPSIALGPTMRKVVMVRGRFRIGSRRSVLVRAKLTKRGLKALETKQSLRGVAATMAVVDSGNGERGQIEVTLVRRPKASSLPEAGHSSRRRHEPER